MKYDGLCDYNVSKISTCACNLQSINNIYCIQYAWEGVILKAVQADTKVAETRVQRCCFSHHQFTLFEVK